MRIAIDPKFPKLSNGNDCNGKAILSLTGDTLGRLTREIHWIDTGVTSCAYGRCKVTGYRVEYGSPAYPEGCDVPEVTYPTLAEATKAIRAHFAPLQDTAIGPVPDATVLARAAVLAIEHEAARKAARRAAFNRSFDARFAILTKVHTS